MEVLGQYHPHIVHTPIALLIFSALFALIGRLFDRDWLRKTAMVMLVIGALGAFVAMRSGFYAHDVPEHEQGVPDFGEQRLREFSLIVSDHASGREVVASRASNEIGRSRSIAHATGVTTPKTSGTVRALAGWRETVGLTAFAPSHYPPRSGTHGRGST